MKKLQTIIILHASLALAVSPAWAFHADIFLTQQDDMLVTGRGVGDPGSGNLPQVGVRFHVNDIVGPVPFVDYNPGISAAPADDSFFWSGSYQPLPAHTTVGFNVRAFRIQNGTAANLFFWDGTGEVDFQPVTNPSDWLEIRSGSLGTVLATGAAVDLDGFDFTATDSLGLIHSHLVYDFDVDDSPATPATTGMFLTALEFHMDLAGDGTRAIARPHYMAWFNGPPGTLKTTALAQTNLFLNDSFADLRLLGDVSPRGDDDLPDDRVSDADIDALLSAISLGSADPLFDLDDDSLVTSADVATLFELMGTQYGDADLDGFVNGADLAIWQANYGTLGGWADGDFSGDARVDGRDFLAWQRHHGFPAVAEVNVVPEPGSLVLWQLLIAWGFPRKVARAQSCEV